MLETYQARANIAELKQYWTNRNTKFADWYEILILIDTLYAKGMESYVSNEPQTFYNMAHYLLTKGEVSHTAPIETESALELDRRAKLNRGCTYMWSLIDRERQLGGNQPYIDELGFYLLVLGWYSTVSAFNSDTGMLQTQIWNPYDVYPGYANNKLVQCVHSYKVTQSEALIKAADNDWNFTSNGGTAESILDDYFYRTNEGLYNMIFIDGKDVTGWVERPNMQLLVAPVGGFPDKGSLTYKKRDWKQLAGRGIFEVNSTVGLAMNKWKSMVHQILRDTAQPITQEFSANPQATPEQLRERGGHFHFAPNEKGIVRVPPAAIPSEILVNMQELRRESQKGSFSDAVYGMVEIEAGYALSLLASFSANQILYPYMDGKHFNIGENDRFFLKNLKTSGKVFEVKGKLLDKIKPEDIPEDVNIIVESDVATSKDWMERGTIANMLDKHLDIDTIITEVYHMSDPQAIRRRKAIDRTLDNQMTQELELIGSYEVHADYLESRGDIKQADRFRNAAKALEARMGAPAPGQGNPQDMTEIEAERKAGAPEEKTRVNSSVSSPEARSGFTPAQLRQSLGKGTLKRG